MTQTAPVKSFATQTPQDTMIATMMDTMLLILEEARATNATLNNIHDMFLDQFTAPDPQPPVTVEQAMEIGTTIAAMDTERFTQRPEKPEVPEWISDIGEQIRALQARTDRNDREITELINPILQAQGHSPMDTTFIYKLRNPQKMWIWNEENYEWRPIIAQTRRTASLVAALRFLNQ